MVETVVEPAQGPTRGRWLSLSGMACAVATGLTVIVAGAAVLGLAAASRRRLRVLLGIAGAMCALAILGMWPIGSLVAPTGFFLLATFFVLTAASSIDRPSGDGRRTGP